MQYTHQWARYTTQGQELHGQNQRGFLVHNCSSYIMLLRRYEYAHAEENAHIIENSYLLCFEKRYFIFCFVLSYTNNFVRRIDHCDTTMNEHVVTARTRHAHCRGPERRVPLADAAARVIFRYRMLCAGDENFRLSSAVSHFVRDRSSDRI